MRTRALCASRHAAKRGWEADIASTGYVPLRIWESACLRWRIAKYFENDCIEGFARKRRVWPLSERRGEFYLSLESS